MIVMGNYLILKKFMLKQKNILKVLKAFMKKSEHILI